METISKPNTEEQALAALAHASVLISVFGPIVPAIIWISARSRSAYVAFHAMQAMGYQMLSFWLGAALAPLLGLALPFVVLPLTSLAREAQDPEALIPVMMLAVWGPLLAVFGGYVVIAIAGAILCFAGRDFYYPFLGNWLARLVGYLPREDAPLAEQGEDRFLAAVAHSTAIITMWGAIFPLLLWATQKERSTFLRFQSAQAAVFQAIAAAAYLVGLLFYVLSIFGIMGLAGIASYASRSGMIPPALALLLIPILCIIFLLVGLGPLYLCLASWASYRILRGHDYRYPLLGHILARRMESAESAPLAAPRDARGK
jgi:uncharacterized Tic20 family protein